MFSDHLFLSSDALSAKSVSHGINKAAETYGEYPLWMPWMFSGLPSTHSMQNISSYYFPHYITSAVKYIGLPWFWTFLIHFLFGGLGMYLFLRMIKLDYYSSLFGAISFMIMPWMVVMIVHGHGSQVMTATYIPWVMWSLLRIKDSCTMQNSAILALILGLQLQRAHVQIAYYTWMIMGIYILYSLIVNQELRENINYYISLLFSMIFGIAMSLWIYLPLLNYAPFSNRGMSDGGGASIGYATNWSLHPLEMLTFAFPSSFGFGDQSYYGYMPMTNFPNYIGFIIILLALYSFYKSSNKLRWFFLVVALLSLLVSFGKYFFVYGIFYDWLPYFNKFRVPSMILVVFQFCIISLAAIGMNSLIKNINEKQILNFFYIPVAFFIFIALCLYNFQDFSGAGQFQNPTINGYRTDMIKIDLYIVCMLSFVFLLLIRLVQSGTVKQSLLPVVIICISFIDIYKVDSKIVEPPKIPITKTQGYSPSVIKQKKYLDAQFKPGEIIDYLDSDNTKFRVFPVGEFKQNNRLVAFNIESTDGYHPAKLSIYENFINSKAEVENILKLMNVKYFLSPQKFSDKQADALSLRKVQSGKYYNNFRYLDAYLYEYLKFEPRVQFLSDLNFVESRADGYKLLKRKKFDIKSNSFISIEDFNKINTVIDYSPNSEVEIKHWSPNEITLSYNALGEEDKMHMILLSEVYFPFGWEIEGVDNAKIIEVNNFLRGLLVPSGQKELTLRFNPPDIKLGSIATYFSSLVLLLMIVFPYIKKDNERI